MRLAAQARAGAEWAFAALVARYQPPVTRYLSRLTGNPALARTLAERIFVRMERRVRGPQGGLHLRLWVLRACTEAGLEAVRQPRHTHSTARLEGPRPVGLLTGRGSVAAPAKLRAGLDALASLKGTTRRQVRKLIWSTPDPVDSAQSAADVSEAHSQAQMPDTADSAETVEEMERLDPREALRYRMVRAVLAELPYGDAQCLALHLVAGLNQAEVAQALGITHSATRKRIVHGLQLFAQRYEAAAISLGLPADALAPSAESATEATATLPGARAEDDELDIADEPTLDWKRPTIVTGTLAAVSPVIRSGVGDDETSEAAARAESDEAGGSSEVGGAAPEPAHVYPAIAEVAVIAAPESARHEQERPFIVALAAEAVAVIVNPPEPPEMALIAPAVLPAPPAQPRTDVRLVPVLTTMDNEREGAIPTEQVAPAPVPTVSAVRIVPILTAAYDVAAEREHAKDAGRAAEAAAETTQADAVRLVPVVTPVADATDADATDAIDAGRNEDLIATTPLRSNNDKHHDTGNGHSRGDANGKIAALHAQSLAVAAVTSDDAGADI